jgi:transcriptional regulator with XRE-family HTH domain
MPGSVGDFLMNLQAQRVAAGYTLNDLARLANVPVFWITQVEAGGNCDGALAQRLADALGVSLVTLGAQTLN